MNIREEVTIIVMSDKSFSCLGRQERLNLSNVMEKEAVKCEHCLDEWGKEGGVKNDSWIVGLSDSEEDPPEEMP